MFRRNESLIDMLPPPEDDEWGFGTGPSPPPILESKVAMGNFIYNTYVLPHNNLLIMIIPALISITV